VRTCEGAGSEGGTAHADHSEVGARTFEELYAWQLSVRLREGVIAICERRAVAKDFKFCDEICASARSAPDLIAEGFGRFGHRQFRHYLSMAHGEQQEVRNQLPTLKCRKWVPVEEVEELIRLSEYAGRVTVKLRSSIPNDGR
jgi:four helix bundle protein